jgi:hypothetical protein
MNSLTLRLIAVSMLAAVLVIPLWFVGLVFVVLKFYYEERPSIQSFWDESAAPAAATCGYFAAHPGCDGQKGPFPIWLLFASVPLTIALSVTIIFIRAAILDARDMRRRRRGSVGPEGGPVK